MTDPMTGAQRPSPEPVDVQPLTPAQAYAALTKLIPHTWRYADDPSGQRYAGPMLPELVEDPLLATLVQHAPDGTPMGWFHQSMIGMCVAALPAVKNNLDEQVAALGPLQRVADQMPVIVANSDHVHDELKQGLAAIQTAVGSIQQASTSLATSLTSITQLAAQAQAQAAIANASATAAGQRCASLEARTSTLETKVANHETRIAALEARKVQMWRAAGNLPTLALNGTLDVTCSWTSTVPNPLPSLDQCQVFVAGSAVPTVKSVSSTQVVVTLKAAAALLPAPAAVQVVAATW